MKFSTQFIFLLTTVCWLINLEATENRTKAGDYLVISIPDEPDLCSFHRLDTKMSVWLPLLYNQNVGDMTENAIATKIKQRILDEFEIQFPKGVHVTIIPEEDIQKRIDAGEIPILVKGHLENQLCWIRRGTTFEEFVATIEELKAEFRIKVTLYRDHKPEGDEQPYRIFNYSEKDTKVMQLKAHDIIYVATPII